MCLLSAGGRLLVVSGGGTDPRSRNTGSTKYKNKLTPRHMFVFKCSVIFCYLILTRIGSLGSWKYWKTINVDDLGTWKYWKSSHFDHLRTLKYWKTF